MKKYINDNWLFKNDFKKEYLDSLPFDQFEEVRIPHTVKEIPFNYVNNEDYQMISTYYKELDLSEYQDKDIKLCFDGVAQLAKVYLNGTLAFTHKNGYTGFKIPLNDYLDKNNHVKVLVELDSHENINIPPFGNVIDYLTYGGIYRYVYLLIQDKLHIEDVFIKARSDCSLSLNIKYSELLTNQKLHIKIANIDEVVEAKEVIEFKDLEVKLWDIDEPNLYELTIELIDEEEIKDTFNYQVGFRSIRMDQSGFYLNDKKIKIRGLNRHQSYPYVGYAMPERPQRLDARILKYQLGLNAVRTSHYPDSQEFIDECDKIGLLVFTEVPGWQHIGNLEWQEQAKENVKEMILENRNHPSIFMWGVRINESSDNHDLYLETNRIAHELDDTRPTGGVRCFKHSELLEDVYTFNDFFHSGDNLGTLKKKKVTKDKTHAFIVTEYNGHMYPTKNFDDEIHRTNHMKRHYQVINDCALYEDHAGSFGWCFADYNTHKDFGSGDQICYHGVMDMFRNPKLAAYAYATQQDKIPILELNTTMDIGEHPGGFIKEVICMTNLDYIKVYKGDDFVREYRPNSKYTSLRHPPIIIDDMIGELIERNEKFDKKTARLIKKCLLSIRQTGLDHMKLSTTLRMAYLMIFKGMNMDLGTELYEKYIGAWGDSAKDFRVEGYKDGKKVKEVTLEHFKSLHFNVTSDTLELDESKSYDVASIQIEALNQANNHMFYYDEALEIKVSGNLELIGPSLISLKGGYGGFYVKSQGLGQGKVQVYHHDELIKELLFSIK